MVNNETIRILNWNINLDLNIITDKVVICKVSLLKAEITRKRPDLIQKHKIKSSLYNGKLHRIVAWDSLFEELIESNTLKYYIYGEG